mgnify:CR=1 FL=1
MNNLLFATHNVHKVEEVQAVIPDTIRLQSLTEVKPDLALPETSDTLEGNAAQKAERLYQASGMDCIADDTGLIVDGLHGAPGVYSARFAGEGATDTQNLSLLLARMEGMQRRNARFKTVICLYWKGKQHFFEGVLEGHITNAPRGTSGFGYDPVFQPKGRQQTLAEMSSSEKNAISHRAQAVKKLATFFSPPA